MKKQNINLYLASPRGFCAGVDRAVKIVEETIKKFGSPVYVRHEIVHNKDVVNSLAKIGAVFVEEVNEAPVDRPIIFSAHGVAKSVINEANQRKMISIDATCPLVTKVHNETVRHYNLGRHILLVGHKNHPEVTGTMGQVPKEFVTLIETEADALNVKVSETNKIAYATQTTLSLDDTAAILKILKLRFPDIKGPNSEDICYATTNRQTAVKSMAKLCDIILVIGAKNSSNSLRLVEVAIAHGVKVAKLIPDIETLEEFLNTFEAHTTPNIGLTAGASAPETLVQVLISKLKKNFEVNLLDHEVTKENVKFNLPKMLR
ncbi:MAG: 4-hydroxy-3-methylbut-2-enyl diphosphate reductase [Alphaproteobacteria bacterium]|jgi:4-hydroxy-3-methylbut-2-enyl diphosphate reductase|nr:4-hydroxy-3-methylbut-2-enyl diphosphate reductase [Alphaproteobacteria bacterium]MDG2457809.1 4-hydroxy-3-methylbut-2-enyl diphosphate reductase [Alphaproteobacteria bacterium]|tara:strand:- start:959 stop:1912 length:954 start_codon:yes stop_codon:yes gene_type:complete